MTLNDLFKVMIGGAADAKGEPSVFDCSCGGGTESGKNAHRNIQDKQTGILLRR